MNRTEEDQTNEVVEHLLTLGDTMLCVDSRHPEVRVPAGHANKADLRLVINLGFRGPIHVLPDGIQADLLFGGLLHHCWIPYEALWGAYSPHTGEGRLWADRMPAQLQSMAGSGAADEDSRSPLRRGTFLEKPGQGKRRGEAGGRTCGGPVLRVIPGGKK